MEHTHVEPFYQKWLDEDVLIYFSFNCHFYSSFILFFYFLLIRFMLYVYVNFSQIVNHKHTH